MVEKQTDKVNITDTGVLSKEAEIDIKSCSEAQEVTDYWDISGAMDTAPGGCKDASGNMKLQNTAEESPTEERVHEKTTNGTRLHDNVSGTDSATAGENSNAMKIYCENGQSAINECGMKNNLNNNNCNQNGDDFVKEQGDCDSKEYNSKNSDRTKDDITSNNGESNIILDQREPDIVGTDEASNKAAMSGVNDIGSNNVDSSGAKDNSVDADNKAETSIRDKMMLDSECMEERFRIDRKKLEQMLQAAAEGRGQSGEEFFQKIMDDTKTYITWPSKMKIGAKSKKDPHIRICGKPDNIKVARQRVMTCLDTKSNRVTIKMDVSHTEHSHVIGKGGNNIKRVMQETGCHIHFPDSNRNNVAEKSNQVSITGHPEGVENARTKIRSLLPIVLVFEVPNTGLAMPDLNSPMIQHLVQAYGISIQFKQRAKAYSTTCTVRGSSDNIDGLKNGIQTLMNHVACAQLPVTTQIEIAPQHHAYMLSKTGMNVNTIIQSTAARIIFPDPNALPKKSTVYVTGSIDSVLLARHKLMGCLPLLLMFDTKAESNNVHQDGVTIAHLMESLDIFINVKLKPKQPSKTIIIKSMEYNIYNMFEARAKLLGLDSVGIPRPAHSLSPKLNSLAAKNPVSPVILLAQSHVPTPTVQTHVLGLTEQKTITPLPCAVLSAPGYVITHSVPSNSGTPRPLSALSAVHTPSQSPFPTLSQPNPNLVQGLGSNPHVNKEILTRDQMESANLAQDNSMNAKYALVNSMSPPTSMPLTQPSALQVDQRNYADNQTSIQQRNGQVSLDPRVALMNEGLKTASETVHSPSIYSRPTYASNTQGTSQSENHAQYQNYEGIKRSQMLSDLSRNRQGLDIKNSFDNAREGFPNYDSRASGPNHYSTKSLPFHGDHQKNIHSLNNTFSPMLATKTDSMQDMNQRQIPRSLSEQQLRNPNQYQHDLQSAQDEHMLRQRYNMEAMTASTRRTPIQSNITPSSSSNNIMQTFGQNIYSPDSVNGSRNSIGSDRNSPMSSISDRFMDNTNSRLGYDQFEDQSRHRSPSPVSSNVFQPLVNRDINSLSPLSGRGQPQHQRSPPQIVLNHQTGNSQYDSTDSVQLNDSGNDVSDLYNQQNVGDMSTGPPPGFESTAQKKDLGMLWQLAQKAMENKPVSSEERTPTDVWSGCGFSKSMPFQMKEDLKKVASRFRNNLPTTYENGDLSPDRNQPSPVNEEDEDSLVPHAPTHLRVPVSHHNTSPSKGDSSLKAWRRKNVMNLSLGGHVGLNFMGGMQRRPQNHSAFTPVHANESINRSSNSPKASPPNEALSHTRPVINSPFNKSGNERMLSYPRERIPENPMAYDSRMNLSSTPTIQDSLGLNVTTGNKNKVEADIADVLNRLDLSKYISVFQQQEVDFQTFLTLTEPDLKELGISTFGPRKKILLAIKDLNKDRDVFSGSLSNDPLVHENPSDQMLQLQRLQLQQHRDNPQTTTSTGLDSHSLLSPSRQLFTSQVQHSQNHLEVPQTAMDRRGVFLEDSSHQNLNNDRIRSMNSGRLWQNTRTGISNSGHW